MKPIILIGGGGHCISCIDVLRLEGQYEIMGILDSVDKVGSKVLDIKIIGTDDDILNLAKKYSNFLITVGQIKTVVVRQRIYEKVKRFGGVLPIIKSPRAYLSPLATIGEGTILMHNSIINAKAEIGNNCIINTGALIEHESIVGDFSHISTYAVINGQVIIGKNSFIGSNAVISNNITLPENIIVGAGACVFKSPEITGNYIGNPATKITNS